MNNRWGKSALAVALGVTLLAAAPGTASLATAAGNTVGGGGVQIMLDDYPLPFDSAPIVLNGITFVPFSAIAKALGIAVNWDGKKQTVFATGRKADGQPTQVSLTIGKKTATVDGAAVPLAGAPVMRQGRVLIPLKFFGEQFGAKVGWNQATHTVTIESPKREMRMLGFYARSSYSQIGLISSLNAVAFGWSEIDQNGQFTTAGNEYKWPKPDGDVTAESIVKNASDAREDSYLMVSALDGNRQLTKVLTDPDLRSSSIGEMTEVAQQKGFGGIMLDYEGLGLKDDPEVAKKQLNDYVKQLHDETQRLGLRLSLAVQPPNGSFKGYDYGTLAKYADELVLMAYMYGDGTTPEPLNKVDAAIQQTLKAGVAPEKLLLGINMGGENENTVESKLGLAKRYGLSGVALWRLGILSDAEWQKIDASVGKREG